MKIIGITGTLGAGKGTVVDYLVNNMGFKHYSVREYLIEQIKMAGLPVNRDTMTSVANKLRAIHSPSYIIEQLYKKAVLEGGNAIIESIRTPGEVDFLKNQGGFYLIAVDANPKVRYSRITLRATETDNISFDTFLENEKREFTTSDPNKQNLSRCIEMADLVIENNGNIPELHKQLETRLTGLIRFDK